MLRFFAFALLLGCWTYSVLAVVAAERYRRRKPSQEKASPATGISILKPLAGLDMGLEANLRSYFEQDYPLFELLFAVRDSGDAPAQIVRDLQAQYPHVASQLIVTGEPPYPHDKVFKLQCLLEIARYELIAMADSDVRAGSDFCRQLAAEFSNQNLALTTCPYRAIGGPSLWSRLEALSMNTDFFAGVFTAVMLEGAKFAIGPTIVARRSLLQSLGGIERFRDYISEDFVLGHTASEQGFGVDLSSYTVEHRIGSEVLLKNFAHRARWARTTRRSRPAGYIGQFFTYPVSALSCILFLLPFWKPLLAITVVLRVLNAYVISDRVLRARVPWHLLPLQDLLSFAFWLAGFFGNSVEWRGRRYLIKRDGTLEAQN
ncbi:MAG TPA: glycosyltransferase [Bryobacteraceae bacterium]|nr:glycosyltransferase [Bryobacteraceae bacterium]